MSITRPWAKGPGWGQMLVPGDMQELGIMGEMEASWTMSRPISIILGLRLHLASLSFACSGNSKGSSFGSLKLPCCCLDSGCLDPPQPHAAGPPPCASSGGGQGSEKGGGELAPG